MCGWPGTNLTTSGVAVSVRRALIRSLISLSSSEWQQGDGPLGGAVEWLRAGLLLSLWGDGGAVVYWMRLPLLLLAEQICWLLWLQATDGELPPLLIQDGGGGGVE